IPPAQHHRARARPRDNGAVAIGLQYGLPGQTAFERPTEIVRETSEQIDESGRPQGLRHSRIVRRCPVDERHREDILGPEPLEPANAVVPGAFVIVIRRSGGWGDPDPRRQSNRPPAAPPGGTRNPPPALPAAPAS